MFSPLSISIRGKLMPLLFSIFLSLGMRGYAQWNELQIFSSPDLLGSALYDIEFLNDTLGYMIGTPNLAPNGSLHKTVDGGNSWFKDTLFQDTAGRLNGLVFVNDSIALISVAGRLYRTQDTCKTWQNVFNTPGAPSYNESIELKFPTEKVGFGKSPDDRLYRSGDYGQTWNLVRTLPRSRAYTFLDSLTGFMVSDSLGPPSDFTGIRRTTDGGQTWDWVHTFANYSGALPSGDIACTGDSCILIDANSLGLYFRTFDRGQSWTTDTASNLEGKFSIRIREEDGKVFSGSPGGKITTSTDFGATWTTEYVPPFWPNGGIVISFAFKDSTCVYAVGAEVWLENNCMSPISNLDDASGFNAQLKLFPNPARDHIRVRFDCAGETSSELYLLDQQGHILKEVPAADFHLGENEIELLTDDLSPGLYYVRLRLQGKSWGKPVLVID